MVTGRCQRAHCNMIDTREGAPHVLILWFIVLQLIPVVSVCASNMGDRIVYTSTIRCSLTALPSPLTHSKSNEHSCDTAAITPAAPARLLVEFWMESWGHPILHPRLAAAFALYASYCPIWNCSSSSNCPLVCTSQLSTKIINARFGFIQEEIKPDRALYRWASD